MQPEYISRGGFVHDTHVGLVEHLPGVMNETPTQIVFSVVKLFC